MGHQGASLLGMVLGGWGRAYSTMNPVQQWGTATHLLTRTCVMYAGLCVQVQNICVCVSMVCGWGWCPCLCMSVWCVCMHLFVCVCVCIYISVTVCGVCVCVCICRWYLGSRGLLSVTQMH